MPTTEVRISELAGLELGVAGELSGADRQALANSLRDAAREIKVLRTADVGEKMLGAVTEALREPLADVLGEVWKQRKEMREIAAKGAEAHDVEGDVELIKHTVTWGLHPTIRLELNGQDVGKVDLDVDISLKIEGVQLVIKNARITKIKTGDLTSTVALKWKGLPLGAPRTRTINLPGELALPTKGIDLSAADRPARP